MLFLSAVLKTIFRMKNIYFRNRAIIICTKEYASEHAGDKSSKTLSPSDNYELSALPLMMESATEIENLYITENEKYSQEEIYKQVTSHLQLINAGGGVITNSEGRYLMILRRGVWDLPKGKQEEGEDIALTAHREVLEEVGLDCNPEKLMCVTHHIYRLNGTLVLKDTYWYSMVYSGTEAPVPQTEEQIEKCDWCSPEEVAFNLQNSYSSIVEVFASSGII